MRYKNIFLAAFLSCMLVASAAGQNEISIARFGAVPNDTINDRNAIQQAIDYCKIHKIKKLIFPPGTYAIKEAKAIQLMHDVMNGKFGKNSQDSIYRPYYPYTKGMNFSGIQNLQVEATGAFLSVYGFMEPVSINYSGHITIKGLTIDYATMPHSEGVIIKEGDGYFDVKFNDEFTAKDNMPMLRIMFWDVSKNRVAGKFNLLPFKKRTHCSANGQDMGCTPGGN